MKPPFRSMLMSVGSLIVLGGCAISREAQLHRKADRVESSLKQEQARVLSLGNDSTRSGRLDHLTVLRATLSAANIGLGAVPYAIPREQRNTAYDVLEEAYDTIDWNIPLGPSEQKRALPARFANGTLNLN